MQRSLPSYVQVGRSDATDEMTAAHEALLPISVHQSRFILAFVPSHFDVTAISRELKTLLGGVPLFGCTTAGQISSQGYERDTLLLLSFPRAYFRCASLLFEDLKPLSPTSVALKAKRFVETFQHTARWNRLALMITDGLSKQEDLLVSTLETILEDLPIFGGSAGDGLRFSQTFVLNGDKVHTNAAVLLLIETALEFQGLSFDHFMPDGEELVITESDPDERLVYEINGSPATQEYARLVGCPVQALSPEVFAENPMLLRHNSRHYVRAISDTKDHGALAFLAAIDDGLILTLGRGREILKTLDTELTVKDRSGHAPDFILGFDCVLRRLEIEQKSLLPQASEILQNHRVFGFNTYGEQQSGVHMNQTFVGVAFFEPDEKIAV